MRKLFIPIIIILVMFLSTGCGNKNVTETQILSDLKQIDYSEQAFQSPFTTPSEYSYTSEKLVKRQTNPEKKEDIIFYEVQINNDFFQTCLSVKLVYNYYDEGGWVLDEHFIERTKVEPTAFPATDLIADYLSSEDNTFNYIDNTKPNYSQNDNLIHFCKSKIDIEWKDLNNEKGIATFNISATIDDFATITGNMDICFDEDNGWSFFKENTKSLFIIENKDFNYNNKCTGKYNCNISYSWGYVFNKDYYIKSIDTDTETIEISDENGEGQMKFDPLTLNGFMTYSDDKPYMYYSSIDDTWNFGEQKYIKQ